MSETPSAQPYRPLGQCLKLLRVKNQKTLAEVSGALEIEEEALALIEQGVHRPAEDILILLINHFDISVHEATKLWTLAGYEPPKLDDDQAEAATQKQLAVLMPLDSRIVFTDDVDIHGKPDSMVINFLQTDLITYQSIPVARVGMTSEQAKRLLEQLRKTLYYHTEPKALPAPKPKTDTSN